MIILSLTIIIIDTHCRDIIFFLAFLHFSVWKHFQASIVVWFNVHENLCIVKIEVWPLQWLGHNHEINTMTMMSMYENNCNNNRVTKWGSKGVAGCLFGWHQLCFPSSSAVKGFNGKLDSEAAAEAEIDAPIQSWWHHHHSYHHH